MRQRQTLRARDRTLNARPDTPDFRDQLYEPTLVEVPQVLSLATYRHVGVPTLDQGKEGACTGFGLATVANYLLRRRKPRRAETPVSPRMFYEMARRYDEWPGDAYEGSSARGAMKGWHKHGVCAAALWPYDSARPDGRLTDARAVDATSRPLGAYFRVNHKDLVAMHTALAEVGVLYASAVVHEGWDEVEADGGIPFRHEALAGHAFAIVAYDRRGFWIQNSWGEDWGASGFALVTYDDWLANGQDVWVARLGVPVALAAPEATARVHSAAARQSQGYAFRDLRPHIISIGNDGWLRTGGTYGTAKEDVETILTDDVPRITKDWAKKRILLYAHGGLVDEAGAVQRVADYREALLANEVYPLAFVWKSDFWTTLTNILEDARRRRRPEGALDGAKDFMLDRLDDALEPLARALTGKAQWTEMKENAILATRGVAGGARLALKHLAALARSDRAVEIHVVGHSAGSIFHAPLVQLLATEGTIASGPMKGEAGYGVPIATCTLWAPACTVGLFRETYLPAIASGAIQRFALFTLTDDAEQADHCAHIYRKSLLYLVSNALEEARWRIPVLQPDGEAILGMERFLGRLVDSDAEVKALFAPDGPAEWIRSPNTRRDTPVRYSTAAHHGDFDDDQPTLRATLARILGVAEVAADFPRTPTAGSLRDRRRLVA